jgi:hypothetical protein
VLILSSLILTQINLFDGLIISEGVSDDLEIYSSKLSTYINPQSYYVGFGGLSYTRIYDNRLQDNIWSEVRPFILSCFLNYESIVEINRDEYIRAFSEGSLLVRMPVDLSVERYYSLFSDSVLSSEIRGIYPREYLLREGNVRSLYVFDASAKKYYLIKHKTQHHDIGSVVDRIKAEGWIEYRKISDRFSLSSTVSDEYNKKNYELIPYLYDFVIAPINYDYEVRLDDAFFSSDISKISSSVFGRNLNFVKRLKDINDSIILMYGYGDKSLTVTNEGVISYREKFNQTNSRPLNFNEAFSLAAGRLENFGTLPEGLFLAAYEEYPQTNTFKFYFNYKLNSFAIAESNVLDHPIVIEVRENQVVSLDKSLKIYTGESVTEKYVNSERLITIDECITINFLEVSIYYLQDNNIYNIAQDTISYYFPIRSEINSIDLRYSAVEEESAKYMIPSWQVKISDRTYIFNAFTGELIKTYR